MPPYLTDTLRGSSIEGWRLCVVPPLNRRATFFRWIEKHPVFVGLVGIVLGVGLTFGGQAIFAANAPTDPALEHIGQVDPDGSHVVFNNDRIKVTVIQRTPGTVRFTDPAATVKQRMANVCTSTGGINWDIGGQNAPVYVVIYVVTLEARGDTSLAMDRTNVFDVNRQTIKAGSDFVCGGGEQAPPLGADINLDDPAAPVKYSVDGIPKDAASFSLSHGDTQTIFVRFFATKYRTSFSASLTLDEDGAPVQVPLGNATVTGGSQSLGEYARSNSGWQKQ